MRRVALVFAVIALAASAAYSGEGSVRRNARHIPGRYIVVLEPTADASVVANSVRNLKGSRIRNTYQHGLKGLAVEMSDTDAQTLARDPRVNFVEEDATIAAADVSWGLDRIDQRVLPLDGTFTTSGSGAGVTIYVVDTGILASHADFGGRVTAGYNALADNGGTNDCNGHGTFVTGLAGGSAFGVAKSATLVPVRVLDCDGSGSLSSVLAGLEWVIADHTQSGTPAVVNMSLGGDASSSLDSEVNSVIAAGMTTVVAAGNGNVDACTISPARNGAAITVGASTVGDQVANFSNFGACVDIFAPGTSMQSDWFTSDSASAVASGTSAAAPLVTGVAALMLEQFPAASPATITQTILSQATLDVLGGVDIATSNRLLFSSINALSDSGGSNGQLLGDPGFDYGTTFWASNICTVTNPTGCPPSIDFDLMSAPSHSGKTHATIGGKASSFDLSSETITIPATVGRAELSMYLWVVTKNKKNVAADTLTVEIRDANGKVLQTLGKYSNLDAGATYVQHKFDVTAYRGQAVKIGFTGVQSQGTPTWFMLDDVAVNIWR